MSKAITFLQRVRQRLRADTEFHGASVRLLVGVAVSTALGIGMAAGKFSLSGPVYGLYFGYFFLLSIGVWLHILWRPGLRWRVYAAIFFDITTTTIGVVLTGPVHSVLFPLYLWITITNGTRYGTREMATAAVVAIIEYNAQLLVQDLWVDNLLVAGVYALFLTIFPAYFTGMIRALHHARQDAEAANRAKSDFLANMSHELRTPMVGVTALSSLLTATPLNREQQGYVTTLQCSAQLLTRLIDDLLDLSRIEAGRLELRSERFDPASAVKDVAEIISQLADQKGLVLQRVIDPQLAPVLGDELRFKQVLLNLLGNAVKFTNQGEVVVRALAVARLPTALRMRFEVEDTGIGIPADQLGHVFERFRQGDNSSARTYQGAGLGAAIAKHLVELMGGTIGVASEPGKGSRFWFSVTLPLAEADAARERAGQAPRVAPWSGPILLVEDNAINAMAIGTILRKAGHEVDVAEDGPGALLAQRKRRYALVFLDMQLPGMDGPDVAKLWREREEGPATPIVALTANASSEDRAICFAAGMDDFLGKPVENSRLLAVAAHYVRQPDGKTVRYGGGAGAA